MSALRNLELIVSGMEQTGWVPTLKAMKTLLAQLALEQREADEWFNLGVRQATKPREVAEPVQDE